MADWQAGDVAANGLRLHYTRTGGNKPPVVLAHGFSDDGLCWTPLAEALAAEYDVIMVDARGHGRSEGPLIGYGSAEHAADLAGAIRALGLERPAVLGHSMGAATTLLMAGLEPQLPRAILLEDPPDWWARDPQAAPFDAEQLAKRRASITELKRKTREELLATQRAATPHWSDAELDPWADAKLRLSFNVLNRGDETPVDWRGTLPSIICPTLLITADTARGAIVSAASATALRALVPQTSVANIAAAGHSIRRDQFANYLNVVRAFLAEHTEI